MEEPLTARAAADFAKPTVVTFKNKLKARRKKEQEARSRRDLLEQSVRTCLVPALMKEGFEVAAAKHGGPVDREFVRSFPPWGRLIRVREPGVDVLEIQFSSYGRAAFRINAGRVPTDGLMTLAGHRPAQEVCVHWLNEFFETHARPWLRPGLRLLGLEAVGEWFSLLRWPHQSRGHADYETLVERVADLVPEIEMALREGKLGPHIRRVVIPHRPIPSV